MDKLEYYAMVADNKMKAELREKNKCPSSNYCFSRISPPVCIRWTTKKRGDIDLVAVVCPSCGKAVFTRKHPNSGNDFVIIPSHNKQGVKA
jgi:ribosomal protein S27AE